MNKQDVFREHAMNKQDFKLKPHWINDKTDPHYNCVS